MVFVTSERPVTRPVVSYRGPVGLDPGGSRLGRANAPSVLVAAFAAAGFPQQVANPSPVQATGGDDAKVDDDPAASAPDRDAG